MKALFAQPPAGLYGGTTLYQCGNEMELENFKMLLDYQENKLRVRMKNGVLTIFGDRLEIAALEPRRLRIRGLVLKTEFSYEQEGDAE